jgi:hypothetical protein
VAWGLHLEARNLEAAIEAAHRACQEHLKTTTSKVEIWQGADRPHIGLKTKISP